MTTALAGAGALQAQKQDVVRHAIWDAAVDLFAAKGFEETTIDDIARAAGVATRTFFRYFSSKSHLMGEGMATYRAMLGDAIHDAPARLSPFEVMRHAVQRVAAEAASHPRTRQIVHIASTSVAAREAQLARRAEVENAVADAYAVKCRTARRDEVTPRVLAGLTLSVIDVAFRVWAKGRARDIVPITEQVFATLTSIVAERPRSTVEKRRPKRLLDRTSKSRRA